MPQIARRNLLSAIAATGALAMIDTAALARPRRTFFQRTGLPVGLQIYTLGDEAGKDLGKTFAEVAAIGYRDIEMPQLYGRPAAEVRRLADAAGLKISSLHMPPQGFGGALTLVSPTEQVVEVLGALGARRAVAPIMLFPATFRPKPGPDMGAQMAASVAEAGADLWKRTAAVLNERAGALAPAGITVGYHNHNLEFAPLATGGTGWDVLAAECDKALVKFEIDVGWIATAGLDPAAFLRRHKGRVAQLHVKDVAAGNTTNFALSMKPSEVGSGTLDWARILPAAYDAGVRHFYVEQEPPFTMARMEAARRSYAFLSTLRA